MEGPPLHHRHELALQSVESSRATLGVCVVLEDDPWEWTGIMRHAQACRPGMDPDSRVGYTSLTIRGRRGAEAVGYRLREALDEEGIDSADVVIARAPTGEAEDTADALANSLGARGAPVVIEQLNPAGWTRRSQQSASDIWECVQRELSIARGDSRAVVLVGHAPQQSWLLHHLVEKGGGGQRRAGPVPLGRGELAMLAGPRGRPRLRFVLTPSGSDLISELQGKIRSKMDSAKLLGAFLTALLLFAARAVAATENAPSWQPWVGGAGVVMLAVATGAYFVTMFRYDELLMPVDMWPSPREPTAGLPRGFVVRPPSSAAWVLYQNMMRIWTNAFVPATLFGGAGAIAVAVALAQPHGLGWVAVVGAVVGVGAATAVIHRLARPNLGVSD